jgi:hypothetical protein
MDGSPCGSDEKCGCICDGAVVADAAAYDLSLDKSWSAPVVDVQPRMTHCCGAQNERFAPAAWPDDGQNVGRTLCRLYSTFLC